MLNCLNCGHRNPRRALYCSRCGGALVQSRPTQDDKLEVLAGPCTAPVPEDDLYLRCNARARHFLLTLVCLLAVPVGLLISGWTRHVAPEAGEPADPLLSLLGFPCLLYICVVHSYLIAKTGEAGGARFGMNFLIGCVPGLTPLVWARLGGRSRWRPYIYILADAALLGGGVMLFKEYPALLAGLVFCVLPFLVHHLLGRAITPLAHSLGLSPTLATLWLCGGPNLLLGILAWDFLSVMDPQNLHQSVALTMAELRIFFSPDVLFSTSLFSVSVMVYLLVTFAAWIKIVYDNLRLPI